jgi:murein DD-endopeptidase MepM/ murein hydrolase activator NlpD
MTFHQRLALPVALGLTGLLALLASFGQPVTPSAAADLVQVASPTPGTESLPEPPSNPLAAEDTQAQGYTGSLRPFLVYKPYTETNDAPFWVNTFFDHRLPLYNGEARTTIPADLRDSNRGTIVNFLGQSVPDPGAASRTLGVNSYSGHDGIDFRSLQSGRAIIAPADGKIRIGADIRHPDDPDNPNSVNSCLLWIDHDASDPLDNTYDFATKYMHMSRIAEASAEQLARPGRNPQYPREWSKDDLVRAGEIIGYTGDVDCGGDSDGQHLHFSAATGSSTGYAVPQFFDPFGWHTSAADPWLDARLSSITTLFNRPARSLWVWAAPVNPGQGQPGYWGDGVAAQTDDADASFQRFGPSTRRFGDAGWNAILKDETASVLPIGPYAWRSGPHPSGVPVYPNWAIWGLHVPADGQYRLQVHLPHLPDALTAATQVAYSVTIPIDDTQFDHWWSGSLSQQVDNAWATLARGSDGVTAFDLRAGTVVLLRLSDEAAAAGQVVVFDAARLEAVATTPPPVQVSQSVGFAIDNSSSMIASGKLSAVKAALPPWILQLSQQGLTFHYALEAFAENTPPVRQTTDPIHMLNLINGLSGNDNGVSNFDCPEASLDAIAQLAPAVPGGHMLFFTDDLPHSPATKTGGTLVSLLVNRVKLHAIILPKTCNFGSGNDPAGWLAYQLLSFVTGGTYQSVTTDRTDEALAIVLNEMRAQAQLGAQGSWSSADQSPQGPTTANTLYPIPVDPTVTELNVLLNVLSGTVSLGLSDPSGTLVTSATVGVSYVNSGAAEYYQIANPAAGTWQAQVAGTGDYRFSSSADTALQFAYLGQADGPPHQPVELSARLLGPFSSANFAVEQVDAALTTPVTMRDDGRANDFVAGDGLYMGWFTPTQVGDYRLIVSGQTAAGTAYVRTDSRLIRIQGVRLTGPSALVPAPNVVTPLRFSLTNLDPAAQTYLLAATSTNGWIYQTPPSSVQVPAGATVTVTVNIRVPTTASPNTLDLVALVATRQSDSTVLARASTLVSAPPAEEFGQPDYRLFAPFISRP